MRSTIGLMAAAAIVALCAGTAVADLVAVNHTNLGKSFVFDYNTSTNVLALVNVVTWTNAPTGHNALRTSAGKGYSFWAGSSAASTAGAERFVPNGSLDTWSSDLGIDMVGESGANEYYDSSVRGAVSTATVNPSAAELSNGTFMASDTRGSTYGVGDITGQGPGIVTQAFPVADAQHLGNLNSSLGAVSPTQGVDVVSTITGASNRFVVTSTANSSIMVYNSDGTFKGNLTDIIGSTTASGVGTMKPSGQGDVALIVASTRSTGPVMKVVGVSVADGDFDSVVIPEFTIAAPGTGDYFIQASDVDGTESGLIVVVGQARRPGVSGDSVALQFFRNVGGTWTATTTNPFFLKDWDAGLGGVTSTSGTESVAGLVLVPEPATIGLLSLGAAGMAALRRRRRR